MTLPVSTLADRGIRRLPEGVLPYPWDPETVEATIQESLQRVKQMESVLTLTLTIRFICRKIPHNCELPVHPA